MMVLFSVEFVNLAVLLTSENILNTVMNFFALVIIAEFDEILFLTVKKEPLSLLLINGRFEFYPGEDRELDEITLIQTTTSGKARFNIDGNRIIPLNVAGNRADAIDDSNFSAVTINANRIIPYIVENRNNVVDD